MKRTSLRLFTPFLFISLTLLHAGIELDYLNSLRIKAGMTIFAEEIHLNDAAENHSDYMQINNTSGHYEESAKSGYTGDNPLNRALYGNYSSRIIGENVSWGLNATYKSSIDQLFSAIYHRYGFLNLTYDEIGIGISDNEQFYTYDMGNAGVNDLCENNSGGNLSGICKDTEQKIENVDFIAAINVTKDIASKLIVWPPVNGDDILPVFYEESPDPLPNDSVTGYPISVEFNDGKFDSAPTISKFTVNDIASGKELEEITLMSKENDPNLHFTDYQFAIFPKKRLEWGSAYMVELVYNYNGAAYTMPWCFTTRSLKGVAERFYRIENNTDISLNAVSNNTYAIYVVPKDTNDRLGNVNYSYSCDDPTFSYIDANTFLVKITGNTDEYISFTFDNGQKIKLTLSSSDTSTVPAEAISNLTDSDGDGIPDSCDSDDDNDGVADSSDALPLDPTESIDTDHDGIGNNADSDDDNDGILDSVEIANGLNPLNTSDAQADFDGDGFSNAIEISVGSDLRSAKSHPVWTPIIMGEIMTFTPSFL